ncbi:hypothetical protein [Laspinema olomoucense]|uniref:Reverse transcriptase domain-containing protein n=1 Tax=Laspinema olomoucense D3b TaxID=2953688 RepID=A0ABT2N0P1_9CYAN|nr:hypothetical protein [Laspinema sp. D3b]MCT7976157.1 hypothetical protein [Laspinema sp. D3b]
MTNNSPLNLYSFHPHTAEVYTAVHKWLATQKDAEKYKSVRYPGGDQRKQQMEDLLNEPTLKMAAAQYNIFFPTHYFKVLYTLENIVTLEKICNWFTCNPHLYFIDIGCGAGAASAAFLQTTLSLVENQDICLIHPLYISCVGIDVNKGALPLYNQLMLEFQKKLIPWNINLEFTLGLGGIRENILTIRNHLIKKREKWNQPCLSNILMFQSNVIDMLEQEHSKRRQEDKSLIGYNVNSNVILSDDKWFADDYAMVYKQLFEEIPGDLMHTITIGTSNSDNHRVKQMGAAIDRIFGSSRHQFESVGKGTKSLTFKNPQNSYWENNPKDTHIYFHVDVSKITSVKLEEDQDWHNVTSRDNLEVAWVRARKHLLKESLCDEVEIRLFEKNLERNLNRLQVFLVAYVKEVDHEEDYISYPFPKKISQARWRGLSGLEEEILSVAIIQKLGNKVAELRGSSYAYRMTREPGNKTTEYLYSSWFGAYKNFVKDACLAAEKFQACLIIRADIKSFYTHIIQDKLISLVSQELIESKRIRWLLRLLLSKN